MVEPPVLDHPRPARRRGRARLRRLGRLDLAHGPPRLRRDPLRHRFRAVPIRLAGTRAGCRRLGPLPRKEIDHDPARTRPLPPLPACPPGRRPPGPLRPALLVVVDGLGAQARPGPGACADADANRRFDARPEPRAILADDDDDDDADDDDDDDDDDDASAKAKKKAEAKAKAAAKAKAKAEAKARNKAEARKGDIEVNVEIDEKFGPEFEKKMEALGEKIGKEMEAKFGPGSEFQKKMEQFGKEMEAKFGPGSEFEKQMKELGEDLGKKLGPGSDFEKEMKKLGEDLGKKLGPGSEFEKQMKELGQKMKEKAEAAAPKNKAESPRTAAPRRSRRPRPRRRHAGATRGSRPWRPRSASWPRSSRRSRPMTTRTTTTVERAASERLSEIGFEPARGIRRRPSRMPRAAPCACRYGLHADATVCGTIHNGRDFSKRGKSVRLFDLSIKSRSQGMGPRGRGC